MKNRLNLYLAVVNLFFVSLGVGLVIPVMPLLRDIMGLSEATMGMLVSTFAISQLIISPISGYLADRISTKKVIISGMLLFSLSELIFGLSQVVSGFYVSRIIGGISAALVFPSVTAYVAKITEPEERPKAMGKVSAAISGGFIVGPGLGGFMMTFGVKAPFYIAALLGFVGFFISLMFLEEVTATGRTVTDINSMKKVLKNKAYIFPFIVIGISAFGLQAFESIYGVMTAENFQFTPTMIASVITISGVISILFQLLIFSNLVKYLGEINLIIISFLSSALFIFLISMTRNKMIVIISTFIILLSFNLIRPAITTYLSKNAGDNQGIMNGLNSTFTSFGNIIGPMVAGLLFDINHFYPYYISAITLLITGLLSIRWKKMNA